MSFGSDVTTSACHILRRQLHFSIKWRVVLIQTCPSSGRKQIAIKLSVVKWLTRHLKSVPRKSDQQGYNTEINVRGRWRRFLHIVCWFIVGFFFDWSFGNVTFVQLHRWSDCSSIIVGNPMHQIEVLSESF